MYINFSYEFDISKVENYSEPNEFINILNQDSSVKQEVYALEDDKFYEHLNFNDSIETWSDFLMPKLPVNTINEIKTIDFNNDCSDNYLVGVDFFTANTGFKHYYLEHFEDNFRKQLENCDLVDKLFISCDMNSVWSGISNVFLSEIINYEVPKVTKIIQASDDNNYFKIDDPEKPNMKIHNTKKLMNYLYYFADLIEMDQTFLFTGLKNEEDIPFFENLFGYKAKDCKNPHAITQFYTSSLIALDNINLLLPSLSAGNQSFSKVKTQRYDFFNGIVKNNLLNFYHSDLSFNLEEETTNSGKNKFINNGMLFTYNKNLKENVPIRDFNWDKHFSYLANYKAINFSVCHGYHEKYRLMTSNIDKFLGLVSSLNYCNVQTIPLPFSFPRNVFFDYNKKFITSGSLFSLYSHDYLYPNNLLSYLPVYTQSFNFQVEKYLRKVDYNKFLELGDKVESLYHCLDFYDSFKPFDDEESDEGY